MGVGVFSSTFEGTGKTFIVSGQCLCQSNYDEFAQQVRDDGDEPVDSDTWFQDQAQDEYDGIVQTLQGAAQALGLTPADTSFRNREHGPEDFVLIAQHHDSGFCVGLRSWELDYIVGVWQAGGSGADGINEKFGNFRDDGELEIFLEAMAPPKAVLEIRDRLVENLDTYFRATLQKNNYECRYRTGGYTTSTYTDEVIPSDLQAQIKADFEWLGRPASAKISDWTHEDMDRLCEIQVNAGHDYWRPFVVPVLDLSDQTLVWLNPNEDLDDHINSHALENAEPMPESLTAAMPEHSDDQFVPILESDALLELCKTRTIQHVNDTRPAFCVPASIWMKHALSDLSALNDECRAPRAKECF